MSQIETLLKNELVKRQKNNSAYSLRSFARFLEVSPATLSQVMSGKRSLSLKKLNIVMEKLGLTPDQQLRTLKKLEIEDDSIRSTVLLKDDQFKLISDWYHFAILSLGELKDNKADPRWIAKRLNIKVAEANIALLRLERLGIIEIKEGSFRQISEPLKTTTDVPSSSIRKYHKSVLGLAQNRIEEVPVEEREYSTMTMAINTKNLKKAKGLTQEYKEGMLKLLEKGTQDEVYQLSIQLFPLSLKDKK